MFAGRCLVAGHRGAGGLDGLVLKMGFVDVHQVAHLPGEQFDLQMAEAQGLKVGGQARLDTPVAAVEGIDRRSHGLPAVGLGHQPCPFVLHTLRETGR